MTCNTVTYLIPLRGCKYVDRSQQNYFTKRLWVPFNFFSPFHVKQWNILQLVIKNTYSCPNRSHVLYYSLLNKYENFKLCKICLIFHFTLKIYYNFESYQNMLITLGFVLKNHKLQLCFVCYAHSTPFNVVKDFWNFWKLKNIVNF
jgi:hypothetical protein